MPIALKPQPLPSWADPQDASVFDPLYKTLIRKAVGGLGLNDPTSSIMTAASPLTMAAGPVEEGSGLIGRIMDVAKKKLTPPAQELVRSLYEFNPKSDMDAELQALSNRVTPSKGLPSSQIKAPKGFTFAREVPQSEPTIANIRNKAWQEVAKPIPKPPVMSVGSINELPDVAPPLAGKPQSTPPPLSTKGNEYHILAAQNKSTNRLNHDIVRHIRSFDNFADVQKAYPNIPQQTLRAAYTKDTWRWVK